MSVAPRATRVPATGVAWVLSLVVHLGLASGVVALAVRNWAREDAERQVELARLRAAGVDVTVDVSGTADGALLAAAVRDPRGESPNASGGSAIARVDDGERGRGGDEASDQKAIHLSDRDERLRLSPDLISHLDRDQQQRIKSNTSRASWEDRRSTTHPMEATFIAMGKGSRQERRVVAATDPSRGALQAVAPSTVGGRLGELPSYAGDDAQAEPSDRPLAYASRDEGARDEGSLTASPGLGAHGARPGGDHRASAAVANARPDVTEGPVAIPATDKARPRDDVDSEQEVSTIVRALVHASSAGGPAGDGRGGTGGGGPTAAGGVSGAGSHSAPLGVGEGELFDLDTSDPRLVPYFRRLHAKIDPLWADAFPRSAMLELKQGTVILDFTVDERGAAHVSWPPFRPSGIPEFDRNCAEAIRKASPFDPLPPALGVKVLHVRAPFTARSTIVD